MDIQSQSSRILTYLRSGKTLTAVEALQRFGCFRLAARVRDLRDEGHQIQATRVELPNGKHVAKYRLSSEAHTTS